MKDKLIELIKFSLNDKTNYINRELLKSKEPETLYNKIYVGVDYGNRFIHESISSSIVFKNKDNKEVTLVLEYDGFEKDVEFNKEEVLKKEDVLLHMFEVEIIFKNEPRIIIRTEKDTDTTNIPITGFRHSKFNIFGLRWKKKIDGIHKVSYFKIKHTIRCDNVSYEIDEELMVEFYNLAVENGKKFNEEECLDITNDRLQKYKDR